MQARNAFKTMYNGYCGAEVSSASSLLKEAALPGSSSFCGAGFTPSRLRCLCPQALSIPNKNYAVCEHQVLRSLYGAKSITTA